MSQSLGEKLRAAREQRGISISEVAEQTRISPLYLEAIDADNNAGSGHTNIPMSTGRAYGGAVVLTH